MSAAQTTTRGCDVTDMAVLGAASNVLRSQRAQVRRALRDGTLTVGDVLAEQPACVQDVLIVDLLRWQRFIGDERLRRLNVAAIRDRVNLCLPVRMCSARTRGWLADSVPLLARHGATLQANQAPVGATNQEDAR